MITFIYTYSGKDSDLPTILYITKRFRSIFLWKKNNQGYRAPWGCFYYRVLEF